jgi:hypothetical protein
VAKKEQYLAEFEAIAAQNGGLLRCEDVVEFARDARTALHSVFEWDDGKAATAFRLQQARGLIRVVVAVTPADDQKKIRAFVSLKPDRYGLQGGGYRAFVTTMADGDMRKQLLADAYEEMQCFLVKFESLKELSEIFEAMSRVVKTRPARKAKGAPATKYKRHPQPTA